MSAVYPLAKAALLKGDVDLDGTVKIVAVDATYVYSAAHDFLNDVVGGSRLGTAQTLTSKTFTGGQFAADPVTYTGVAVAEEVAGFVGYIDAGDEATSTLVWFCDTRADQTAIAYTGDGAAISITWPYGYIFTI